MFIVTLCMIGKIWKQPKHLSTEQQNVVYTHTHTHTHTYIYNGILFSHKKKETLPFATMMNLESIMRSEISLI